MQIDYTLPQAEKEKLKAADPGNLELMILLYHYTDGSVELLCADEGKKLELNLPVLDFAWCLLHILNRMQADGEAIFEFTESARTILFRYSGEVIITTSFSEWTCQCSYDDLRSSVLEFNKTLLDDLCGSVPGFEANSLVGEARKKIADYRR